MSFPREGGRARPGHTGKRTPPYAPKHPRGSSPFSLDTNTENWFNTGMALNENPREIRHCDICNCELIYIRRVTRSTYVCPFSTDHNHVETRRHRRVMRQIEEIESLISQRHP